MTEPDSGCQVSEKCQLTAYVVVMVAIPTAKAMAPFGAYTRACRRHVSMVIEHAVSRRFTARVKGIGK